MILKVIRPRGTVVATPIMVQSKIYFPKSFLSITKKEIVKNSKSEPNKFSLWTFKIVPIGVVAGRCRTFLLVLPIRDDHHVSRLFIRDPDPGVKNAPNPGSGSAMLLLVIHYVLGRYWLRSSDAPHRHSCQGRFQGIITVSNPRYKLFIFSPLSSNSALIQDQLLLPYL